MRSITDAIARHAQERPDAVALAVPAGRRPDGRRNYRTLDYATLDRQTTHFARGFVAWGLRPGQRVVLMVKPSLEFFPLTFGIMRAGLVPVMVDPGIGRDQLAKCLAEAAPDAFVGIPLAHVARVLLGWGKKTIRHNVTVGRVALTGGTTHHAIAALGAASDAPLPTIEGSDSAAILFTSGSTGVAKGVVYRHEHFVAQVEMIRGIYGIEPGEVDLPTFPLFALFDPALGMTTVIPEMDFTRPARVNPAMLDELVSDWKVTNVFGSPAALNTIARYSAEKPLRWPGVRRVLSAGAPMPVDTLAGMGRILAHDAQVFTPYGATECLPVASIGSHELATTRDATNAGAGVCVGHITPPNDVRIIAISDDAISDWNDVTELPAGQIGEITVLGPTTTDAYFGRPEATRLAKIRRDGRVVHRMGDTGYFDEAGRLWFCGRKSQRVIVDDRVLHTAAIEAIFNTHPAVFRTALVGVIRNERIVPVLCVEREKGVAMSESDLFGELRTMALAHDSTREIEKFLVHPSFPVDVRHNAKIGREKLTVWASEHLK